MTAAVVDDLHVRYTHGTDGTPIPQVIAAPDEALATVELIRTLPPNCRVVGTRSDAAPEFLQLGTSGYGLGVVLYRIRWATLGPLGTVEIERVA